MSKQSLFTVKQLADTLGIACDALVADVALSGVASLASATATQLAVLKDPRYLSELADTQAGVVLLAQAHAAASPVPCLIVDDPAVAFAKVAQLFDRRPQPEPGVHSSAIVPESCELAADVSIGAGCVLGERVRVGAGTVIGDGCHVGAESELGECCHLYPRVTLYHGVKLADRVSVHSGTVIGSDGFGLAQDKETGQWLKVPQLGTVVIESDVEIGANSTIDRGTLDDTQIGRGVKIDNQVQIAHNVQIGAGTAIAACVGIAGSTTIGKHCLIGGACAINGHIKISDGVMITGMSSVQQSIDAPGVYSSTLSTQPRVAWNRTHARILQLDKLAKRVNKLERKCNESNECE